MPSVEDLKMPYEILVRFGDDGKPRGAHAQYIRRVTVDGELLKEEIGNAEPLDLEGFPTSGIMSDTLRDALAEVTRLNATVISEREAANAHIAELEKSLSEMQELSDKDAAERDAAKAHIAELEQALQAAAERVSIETDTLEPVTE